MYYILTCQVLRGKYSRWIVILQEFDLDFVKATSKKSLVFAEIMCDLSYAPTESKPSDSFSDEFMFLSSSTNPWYGDFLFCLQTQQFQPHLSHDDHQRICHHAKYYFILNDTLYRSGINSIL